MAFGDFTVARTSVKHVLNASGVLASVAANTPAFEFNTDGSYRGLLVEPAGTNLWLRSEPADGTGYSNTTGVVFQNASTVMAPLGTKNVVRLEDSTISRILTQNITVTNGVVYTLSGFVRLDSGGVPNAGSGNYRDFTLTRNNSDILDYTSITYENWGGGVYRFMHTFTSNGVNAFTFRKYVGLNSNEPVTVTGFQLETGEVATSYIPTVASTETRTADSVSLTGASSLIGQTEGTLYVEVELGNFNSSVQLRRFLSISDGTGDNRITISSVLSQNNRLQGTVHNSGVLTAQIAQSADNTNNSIVRCAIAYAVDDVAFYVSGTSIGTDTSSAVPACSRVDIGGLIGSDQPLNAWIRAVALYPTRLSNAQLATLTT